MHSEHRRPILLYWILTRPFQWWIPQIPLSAMTFPSALPWKFPVTLAPSTILHLDPTIRPPRISLGHLHSPHSSLTPFFSCLNPIDIPHSGPLPLRGFFPPHCHLFSNLLPTFPISFSIALPKSPVVHPTTLLVGCNLSSLTESRRSSPLNRRWTVQTQPNFPCPGISRETCLTP